MARGSLKDPFKKDKNSPLKNTGSNVGSTIGGVAGSAIGGPVGGLIGSALGGFVGGFFGSDKDQAPAGPSAAELDVQQRMKEYEDFQFRTANPYEDMQVDLQAAEFQRSMQAQQQANTLQALRGAGGAAGAASLATAMSRQAAEKERAISADISKQEQNIKLASAEQIAKNQTARQQFELGRMETMLGISMSQATAEEQARLAAEQNKANQGSQLLGVGLNLLGTLGSSFIESGGLQPKNTTDSTPLNLPKVKSITPPDSLTPKINTSGMRTTINFGGTPSVSVGNITSTVID